MGIPSGGFNQSGQNMVLEFGDIKDIPIRLAASGSTVNFVGAIGPLLGGLIVWTLSYQALFITTIVLQLVGLVILVRWVPEPRRRPFGLKQTPE
jgi:MFS family permease